ncbi:hypothetical protein LO771_00850 [Streptacidiphilus sp. ASG 303]|uniref:hypothetical protein n=1 Tax=Streptacidiphilus sp. ASG 303 TaxID=2896847 RepID=UPI001E33A04A|nr:hypothetical protein [Streptacidiphilus sp. ASG 303]MCD0481000.1 hypothetical protein [Streptacidiphilus sp. ASG 303]
MAVDGTGEGVTEGLGRRLAVLEAEVERLREEVACARALAAMADRDTADLRADLRAHGPLRTALRTAGPDPWACPAEPRAAEPRAAEPPHPAASDPGLDNLVQAVGCLAAGQADHSRHLAALVRGQEQILTELRRLAGGSR